MAAPSDKTQTSSQAQHLKTQKLAPLEKKSSSYASISALPKRSPPTATLIVSSNDPRDTSERVLERIRGAANTKATGARVDTVRKAQNQKVVLKCHAEEDARSMLAQLRASDAGLAVIIPASKIPLVDIRDVLKELRDAELVENLKGQNKKIFEGLQDQDRDVKVLFEKRARHPQDCHPVFEVAPKLWQRLVDAGRVHIGIQFRPVRDQSPLVQCTRCLGFGHGRSRCPEEDDTCAQCARKHR